MRTALAAWDAGQNLIGARVQSALIETPTESGTITALSGSPYAPGAMVLWDCGRDSYWTLAELRISEMTFTCKCCGAPLHSIDPEDICMVCVDMGCNVKD